MSLQRYIRGASESGALFVFCFLLLAFQFLPARGETQPLPQGCQPAQIDERVQVSYVYDGDTVKLSDGRRVRFIGINAPETGHHDTLPQPYAEAARTSLQAALDAGGGMLSLQYGSERKDHYGRLLAHAYLGNGENVAALLLRQGQATTLAVPPNTAAADCYQQIENEARSAGRGLWQLEAYQPRDAVSLADDASGFYIVHGLVAGIHRTRHQVRVALEGKLVARISTSDLANFEPGYLEKLVGRTIEVRGWIKPDKSGLGIRVRHPAALSPAGESSGAVSP